jgi:uncharacterized protein (TIGR03118 family)
MSPILTSSRMREPWPAAAAALIALALQACGGGKSAPPAPPPTPTVTLSVSPTSITAGQSATLTWSSTQAVSCAASGGWSGSEAVTGTQAVTPAAAGSATYTLTCTGAGTAGGAYGGGTAGLTAAQTTTLTVNPATAFVVKALVADGAGVAVTTDTHLVNAWGLVFAPNDPVWISNNGTNTSSLYDGNGTIVPLDVALPADTTTSTTLFQPTGIVASDATKFPNDFVVTAAGKSGPSSFIFSGLGGQIAGSSAALGFTPAVSAHTETGACYRGLAIANNGTANFLYANDFVGAKIDVYDAKFVKQSPTAFPFTDPNLPKGYAPFGIQAIANGPNGTTQIYVSYAMSGTGTGLGTCEDTRGAGFGMIDVFDANGKLVTGELVAVGGLLNAPWGMALAPKDFGTLSNALLVSNHADGTVNAYDPVKGTFIGTLQTATGPFAQDGLWGIAFGNDGTLTLTGQPPMPLSQPHNTLFFTAGPNKAVNGLYGRIDLPVP